MAGDYGHPSHFNVLAYSDNHQSLITLCFRAFTSKRRFKKSLSFDFTTKTLPAISHTKKDDRRFFYLGIWITRTPYESGFISIGTRVDAEVEAIQLRVEQHVWLDTVNRPCISTIIDTVVSCHDFKWPT